MNAVATLVGEIECLNSDTLAGWALLRREDDSEIPATLELFANDVLLFRFAPNVVRSDIVARGRSTITPIGFKLEHGFRCGERIELRSAETGALLGGVQRFVPDGRPLRMGIVTPARNEGRFLLEWIAHHRLCGFGKFYIADNGGEDDTSELLRRLDAAGIVKRYDYVDQTYFQIPFYERVVASPELRAECDVVAMVDCDEFIVPTSGRGVPEIVAELFSDAKVSAIALNWANYGTSNLADHDDARLVIEQYVFRAEQGNTLNRHAKALFRVDRCRGFGKNVHAVDIDYGTYLASSGRAVSWDSSFTVRGVTNDVDWGNLRINHFSTKSRNEFIKRKHVGRAADNVHSEDVRRRPDFLSVHDTNDVLDPPSKPKVDLIRAEMTRLRGLIGN